MHALPPNRIHVTVQAFEDDAEVQIYECALATRADGEELSRIVALKNGLEMARRKFPTIYPEAR